MKTLFDFTRHYELENQVCKLVPLTQEHYADLVVFAEHEPELWRYSLQPAGSPELLKQYIAEALQARADGKSYSFIVYDKLQKAYAGCTRLYNMDLVSCNTSIGYTWYGKAFQGTGLNKNCKFVLMDFIFDQMHFERLEFRLDSNNQRSLQALKGIGCVQEGILRSNAFTAEGARRDSIVMSILKSEWDQTLREKLARRIE